LLKWGEDFVYADLAGLPELHALNSWLASAPDLLSMYQRNPGDYSYFSHMWFSLVTRTLAHSQGAEPERAAFSRQFKLFLGELYRPSARMCSVTMLTGLDLKFERLRLDEYTHIVQLPWAGDLAGRLLHGQFGSYYRLAPGHDEHSALVTDVVIQKDDFLSVGRRQLDDIWKFQGLETVMRLYTDGVVRAGKRYEFQVARFPLVEPFSWETSDGAQLSGVLGADEKPAIIQRRDIPAVTRLWRELLQGHFDARLGIAISRFRSSYDNPEDLFVDLTIALEAMFGPKEGEELTHRLRLRAAFLLGRTEEEARTIYGQVSTLYAIRSHVLHGRTGTDRDYRRWLTKLTGKKLEQFELPTKLVPEADAVARGLLRRSIAGALGLSQNPPGQPTWPLPDDFDQEMATPRGKRVWRQSFQRAERARLQTISAAT